METRILRVIVVLPALAGCAGPLRGMQQVPPGREVMSAPPLGKAAVVFMRPATVGFGVTASVFELKKDGDVFIGHVPATNKLVYFTDPGPTRFMVLSEAADFMGAELHADTTYYALVTPRFGMWRARFSLQPATTAEDGKDCAEWFKETTWIKTTDEARRWAADNQDSIEEKKLEYLQKWEPKPDKPMLTAGNGC